MIKPEHTIQRFFEKLDIKIKIRKSIYVTGPASKCHILEYTGGRIYMDRFYSLMRFYFDHPDKIDMVSCRADLSTFKECGYVGDICKRCGCTSGDACDDPITGSCWWVMEDVCSACATTDEKAAALAEMKKLHYKGEQA